MEELYFIVKTCPFLHVLWRLRMQLALFIAFVVEQLNKYINVKNINSITQSLIKIKLRYSTTSVHMLLYTSLQCVGDRLDDRIIFFPLQSLPSLLILCCCTPIILDAVQNT